MRVMALIATGGLAVTPAITTAQDYAVMGMQSTQLEVSPEGFDLPSDGPTRGKIAAFGTCLAHRYGASEILSVMPESDRDRDSLSGMGMMPGDCAEHVNYSDNAPKFMRGVYAEWALTHDFDLANGKLKGARDKVFPPPSVAQRARLNLKQAATLSFVEFGECVAQVDMPGVSRLIAAKVGSPAENDAFAGLGPALGQCLGPGQKLQVNRLKLRGYVAEGAYRKLSADVDKRKQDPAAAAVAK